MENEKPKVLICTPTSVYKNYCLKEWANSIKKLTYNADILIVDNTEDNGENLEYISKFDFGRETFGVHTTRKEGEDLVEIMCRCNNICLQFAIENGYDYIMSIESDVFAPCDNAIELLLEDNKEVVGFNYFIDKWHNSRSIIPTRFSFGEDENGTQHCIDFYPKDCMGGFWQMTGGIIEVASLGLGFLLIDIKKVFSLIPSFRVSKNEFLNQKETDKIHADTFFHTDLAKVGIVPYCDTRYTCRHQNTNWFNVWREEYKLDENNKPINK